MLKVIRRVGDWRVQIFSMQMFLTGVTTVILCPSGSGGMRKHIHAYGAAAYMLDHQVFCWLMDMPRFFVLGFWTCFLSFGAGTMQSSRLRSSVTHDSPVDDMDIPFLLQEASNHPAIKNSLWYNELSRTITEN